MLSFAAPAFLALAALIGVILLLHSQRERRRVVGSLHLWQRLQLPAGSRRSRRHLPPLSPELILQIAAVLALALALAQPYWSATRPPDHLVVVLDASGTMALPDGDDTRFATATARLTEILGSRDRVGPERVSLLVAGVFPRLEAARWPWQEEVLGGVLARLHPTDGPADWEAAAAVLSSLLRADEATSVLLLSHDRAPEALREAAAPADLIEVQVGTPLPQMQIRAEVIPEEPGDGRWRVEGSVDFGGGLAEAEIEIGYAATAADAPLPWVRLPLTADAAGEASFSQQVSLPGPGILSVAPASAEAAWSNTARFVLADEPPAVDVLYIGEGGQPLLTALQAIDGIDIYQADALPEDVTRFGLVVLDDVIVPRVPETNTVWIGTARVDGMPEPPPLPEPDPDTWDGRHPLSRDMDWSALRIGAARALTAEPLAETILGSQGLPLIEVGSSQHGRSVHLAFDPTDSNWPDQSSLALFAAGLVEWLGLRPGMLAPACEVGTRCMLDARLAGTLLTPVAPADAPTVRLGDPVEFNPEVAGLFRLDGDEAGRYLAVNAAPGLLDLPDAGSEPPLAASVLARSWSVWLLVFAAGCLAAEGIISARRKGRFALPAPLALGATALALAAVINLPIPATQAREAVMLILPPALGGAGERSADPRTEPLAEARPGVIVADGSVGVLADPDSDPAAIPPAGPGPIPHGRAMMELAAAMIPEGQAGRIVLGADLAVTPGALATPLRNDIVVERLPDAGPVGGEVLVRGIELPRQVIAGDAIPLVGLVHAQGPTDAELRILRDGEPIATQEVALAAGHNRIETTLPELAPGETLVEMEVVAPADTFAENNRAGRIVTALPARPVAILAPDPEHAAAFAAMLEREGLEAVVLPPSAAPQYQREWLDYGGVVLLDMPAIALSVRQHGLIETAVAEHGLGLLILGGPNSFGPGGYFETALERLSPLSSRIPRDAPEVAMVFVLDRSGSMQQPVGDGNRLDVAKRATLAAVELLNPASQVGIVVFDAEATTILPLGPLELDQTRRALESVDPGGGTAIYPGLVEALAMLEGVEAPARHVVVMTDGLSQPGDFPGILSAMRAEGITASAVAIGQGSDRNTVEAIAALGGGSSHATSDFEALPSILSQEAMLLSAPIEEIRSQPRWIDPDAAFLRGLPNPMPPVDGFVLTTPKPQARIAMVTPDSEERDMPLLGWWRYGNGAVVALSTEATGPWTRNWHALESYAGMWGRMLREFQPATPGPGLHLTADGDGEALQVTLTAFDESGAPQTGMAITAVVSVPGSEAPVRARMREERAGFYRAGIALGAPGRYDVTVAGADAATEVGAAFHHSYPVQYDLAHPGGGAARLVAATGGAQRDAAEIRAASAGINWIWRGGWPAWALLALGVFMAELVRRYAGFSLRPRPRGAAAPSTERQGASL